MGMKVEVFSVPGCSRCRQAKAMLRSVVEELGETAFSVREVDAIAEAAYAAGFGVVLTPAIAIDGELVFASLPTARQLCAELTRRLVYDAPAAPSTERRAIAGR